MSVPPEEEEEPATDAGASSANPFGDQEVKPAAGAKPADPFAEAAESAAPASEFSDAVAVQIPSQTPTSARKPYFLFGDSQNSVDLWFYDLARPDPLQFTGKGSADIAPNDTGDVSGVASYNDGEWSVIFKRPLRPSGAAAFTPGEFLPIAFSVWDGASRERGNRRGLTVWESVYMEPEVVPSAAGPMIRTAVVLLAIELAIIGWVRRRPGSGARTDLGSEPMQPSTTRA
jgi:Ethylbenzene dehydrogenase